MDFIISARNSFRCAHLNCQAIQSIQWSANYQLVYNSFVCVLFSQAFFVCCFMCSYNTRTQTHRTKRLMFLINYTLLPFCSYSLPFLFMHCIFMRNFVQLRILFLPNSSFKSLKFNIHSNNLNILFFPCVCLVSNAFHEIDKFW